MFSRSCMLGYMVALFFSLFQGFVFAAEDTDELVVPPTQNLPDLNTAEAGDIIASIISYGIGIASILAIIAITWGGIIMIGAAGNSESMKKGKDIMIYGVVGAFLALVAYLIITLITNFSF